MEDRTPYAFEFRRPALTVQRHYQAVMLSRQELRDGRLRR